MKKTILSIMLLLVLALIPTIVYAAGENVAKVGENEYSKITDALEAAKNSGEDVIILKTVDVNQELIINLDGFNITGEANPLFYVTDGSVKVEGTGKISATKGDVFDLIGNIGEDWATKAVKAELEVGANVELTAAECCIYIKGNGAIADVYGKLISTVEGLATIQGNGNEKSALTVINIYEGASVEHSDGDVAIYHPQNGKLNVYGGTIKGTTGIEMRAGKLLVEGGTIIGTGVPVEVTANGNGSTSFGAGIAIAQHTTKLETTAIINGGNVQGYSAVYQSNPEKNDAESIAKVSVEINGGKLESINNGTVVVYSENNEQFITGGTFNTEVNKAYLIAGVTAEKNNNGEYVVGTRYNVEIKNVENGTVTTSIEKALAGETVELSINPDNGYELSKLAVLNADDNEIVVTNKKFVMPVGGVTVIVEFKIIKTDIDYIVTEDDAGENNIEIVKTEEVKEILDSSLKVNEELYQKVENARENGENVTVEIKVEELEQKNVNEDDKQKLLEKLSDNQAIHQYFDISVLVGANGKEIGKITKLTDKIKVSMEIVEELIKDGRIFYILKLHDGEVEELEAKLNGTTLEFEVQEFSLFSLAYEDIENNEEDKVVEDNDEQDKVETEEKVEEEKTEIEDEVKQDESTEKDDTPKTGAIMLSIYVWITLATITLVGMVLTNKKSKHSK